MALRTEHQSARVSKIKNSGLDQYGAEPFKQQQFETAGVEEVNIEGVNDVSPLKGARRDVIANLKVLGLLDTSVIYINYAAPPYSTGTVIIPSFAKGG